jgi:amidohydrolase
MGTGSHAAFPQVSRDPIVAASALIGALQQIVSRNIDPLDSIVVSVTQIHAGTTHNIIPGAVKLGGTVRTLLPETQRIAVRRLTEIADGIAAAHGCKAEVDYQYGYPVTLNDPVAADIFFETARNALDEARVVELADPVMGAEDFSFYCHEVPSCFFVLGLRPRDREAFPELHQPTFNFNDDAIATGMEMFCRLALRDR